MSSTKLSSVTFTSGSNQATVNSAESLTAFIAGDVVFADGQAIPMVVHSIAGQVITLTSNASFSLVAGTGLIMSAKVQLREALDVIKKNNETWAKHFSPFLAWMASSADKANLVDGNGVLVETYTPIGLNNLALTVGDAATQAAQLQSDVNTLSNSVSTLQASVDADKQAAAASASDALSHKNAAATSASDALAYRNAVEALLDQFDDRYLGDKTSDPTLDNDGDPLAIGQIYYNSTHNELRFFNGSVWDRPTASATSSASQAAQSVIAAAAEVVKAADEVVKAKAEVLKAQQYANHPVDVKIPGTEDYSAFHWQEKARSLAGGTATNSERLGGQLPSHYATAQDITNLNNEIRKARILALAGAVL